MSAAINLNGMRGETAAILTALADAIERGELPPGGRLPPQTELCARYSVTRPTISKVIARLAEEGLVSVRKGAGVFVLRADPVPAAGTSRTVAVMMTMTPEAYAAVQQHLVPKGFMPAVYSQAENAWDPVLERQFLQTALVNRVRGLVAFCSPVKPHNADLLAAIERHGTRVVHIEPFETVLPREGYILPDYVRAGRVAAVDAVLAGYRCVRILSSSEAPYVGLFVEGVRQGLADHAPNVAVETDCWKSRTLEPSQQALRRVLQAANGNSCAILCLGRWVLDTVRRTIASENAGTPWPVGLLAVDFETPSDTVDSLVFSHREAMAAALDWITDSATADVPRRLLAGCRIRRGTMVQPAGTQYRKGDHP